MVYIREVNPNVDIKKVWILGYRRLCGFTYLGALVKNVHGLGA